LPGNNFGELSVGGRAAANYINTKLGGVNGHPIKITDCDSRLDPAATLTCANNAISQHAVAVLGLSLQYGANALSRVAAAGIPSMEIQASPQEFTDPSSLGIGAGTIGEQTAGVRWLGQQKPKSVTLFAQDTASIHQLAGVMPTLLQGQGYTGDVNDVFIPTTTPDLAPFVAKALQNNPDWIWISWANYPAAWKALHDGGYTGHMISYGVVEDVPIYLSRGEPYDEGVYLIPEFTSFDDLKDPEVKVYRTALGKNPVARAEFTQFGWSQVMFAYNAMKKIKGPITGESLLNYLQHAGALHVPMAGNWSSAYAAKDYPGIRGIRSVHIVQWKDGKIVPVVGPLNGSPDASTIVLGKGQ